MTEARPDGVRTRRPGARPRAERGRKLSREGHKDGRRLEADRGAGEDADEEQYVDAVWSGSRSEGSVAILAQVRKIVDQFSFFEIFVEPLGGFTSFDISCIGVLCV